jgi:hypothetical protein
MRITLDLPDDVAESLARNHQDVSRALLESIAIEGCRTECRAGWRRSLFCAVCDLAQLPGPPPHANRSILGIERPPGK